MGKCAASRNFWTGPRVGAVWSGSSLVEASAEGLDTRFIVTNLASRNARVLYEDVYCRRGQAENHIKSWKAHLAADRTSCSKATANQFRLFLHAGAYWLMWGLRESMPKRSIWRGAQFDTLRLRLVKIAARVVEMKTMIRIHLPTSCPAQNIRNCPGSLAGLRQAQGFCEVFGVGGQGFDDFPALLFGCSNEGAGRGEVARAVQ